MSDKIIKNVTKNTESNVDIKRYVVTRSGLRVSELDHQTKEDAQIEYNHWKGIVARWPDGSKVKIVEL